MVGISGSQAGVYNENGIDFDKLKNMVDQGKDFKDMDLSDGSELYEDGSIFSIQKPFDIAFPCATQKRN